MLVRDMQQTLNGLPHSPSYYASNFQMIAYICSSSVDASRAVLPRSLGKTEDPRYTSNNYSIYYNGFAVITSPFINQFGLYLALVPDDPTNKVDVWVRSQPFHGQPLVQVVQTDGSFTKSFETSLQVPLNGWILLDMYATTLIQSSRNPEKSY